MHAQTTDTASGPGRIRQLNRQAVLNHIRRHGPNSRSALIPALGLSAAAVSSVVTELLEDGLLREAEAPPPGGRLGRPVSLLELDPGAACALGLVLRPGGGRVRVEAAWADYAGAVTVAPRAPPEAADLQAIVAGICRAVSALEAAVPDPRRIAAVTVGIPGVVEDEQVRIAPRLPAIEGEGLVSELRRRIPYALHFQNDVNLAAMAELHQQPRLRELAFAYLFIAAGVGAGIAIRGQLWTGGGWAGEVGQLRITRARGRRESFEELLGTDSALAAGLEALGLPRDGLDDLVLAVDARDRGALRLLDDYAAALGDLIQVLNAVLGLDEVIVDFPADALFERLRPRIEVQMADSPLRVAVSTPAVGHSAGIRGAALMALERALETVDQRAGR